jgi:ATP-dependent DNA ligase
MRRVQQPRRAPKNSRFHDVAAAAAEQVPPGSVVDGELVAWAREKVGFAGLQRRMAAGPRSIARLAREQPAYFVGFDVLAHAGVDVRPRPFAERRALLEALARDWAPPLNLSPVMRDRDLAAGWFEDMDAVGLEGLVVKGLAQPYTATRSMLNANSVGVTRRRRPSWGDDRGAKRSRAVRDTCRGTMSAGPRQC